MSDTTKNNIKGFITDVAGNTILPITRGELVLDANGEVALHSSVFAANKDQYGLLSPTHYTLLESLGPNDTPNADNLASILAKLNAINEGIKVDNTTLNFYDKHDNNQSTPIIFKSSETISLTADSNNNITASLIPLPQYSAPTTENVVANVTVDKYGRVTQIESTTALSGVHLTGCTTEHITETSNKSAIVDKQYVDDRFGDISAISTGALKFRGTIYNADKIETVLQEENCYYLIGADFSIPNEYFHDKHADVQVTTGDTLIVYKKNDDTKFEFIPSGDDTSIINLYDSQNDEPAIIGVGESHIRLEYPFKVTKDNNKDINISIPEADRNTAGIISPQLFIDIQTATAKSMSYSPILSTGVPLGEIKIGDDTELPTVIYSPDYSLKYQDDAIKWQGYNKDTGKEELNIQFGRGLLHTHSADTSTIQVNLGEDNKYLEVNQNGVLTAVISEESQESKTGFTQGLIDDTLFDKYMTALATATVYCYTISKSLIPNQPNLTDDTYYYGSQNLIDAIKVEI